MTEFLHEVVAKREHAQRYNNMTNSMGMIDPWSVATSAEDLFRLQVERDIITRRHMVEQIEAMERNQAVEREASPRRGTRTWLEWLRGERDEDES